MSPAASRIATLRAEMRAEGDDAIFKVIEGGKALAAYAEDAATWSDDSIPPGIRQEFARLARAITGHVSTITTLASRRV